MSDKQTNLGVIQGDSVYPLSVFQKLTGLGSHAVRQARKKGLRMRDVGNRSYILGNDFYRFLDSQPQEDEVNSES